MRSCEEKETHQPGPPTKARWKGTSTKLQTEYKYEVADRVQVRGRRQSMERKQEEREEKFDSAYLLIKFCFLKLAGVHFMPQTPLREADPLVIIHNRHLHQGKAPEGKPRCHLRRQKGRRGGVPIAERIFDQCVIGAQGRRGYARTFHASLLDSISASGPLGQRQNPLIRRNSEAFALPLSIACCPSLIAVQQPVSDVGAI